MDKQVTVNFSPKTILVLAGAVLILWLAYFLKDILVLFLIAFIIATAIKPLVDLAEKKNIPRTLSIVIVYALMVLFIYGLIRLIIPPISTQATQIIDNRQEIAIRITGYLSNAPAGIKNLIHTFTDDLPTRLGHYTSGSVIDNALGVFSGLLGFLTIFVISFYLLLEKNSMEDFIEENWLFGSKDRIKRIYRKISTKVSLWIRGQVILSGAIGILTYVGLSVLGIDFALTLAIIAGLTEILPVIGPIIGAVPAVIIAFAISPIMAFWVAILYLGIQQFESQILTPQIMKRAVGLSPASVIFTLLVGAKLLGILGVLIAVPVASSLVVIFEELKKKEK